MEKKPNRQITLLEMIEECEKESAESDNKSTIKTSRCPGGSDLFGN